ncbi:SET domain group 40 [Wolffia australiana]
MRRVSGEEKGEEFLRWAAQAGISDASSSSSPSSPSPSSCLGNTLLISHFPNAGGRGLAAERDLAIGERVLKVPNAALLTSQTVMKANAAVADCITRRPKLSPAQILTVCLLVEVGKGRNSLWYLYISQLPRIYDTLAYFSQLEIEFLQAEDAIWSSKQVLARVHSEWKEAFDLLQEIGINPRLTTFKSWLWASATVSSRALHLPWDPAGCLCPVGDLFNYAIPGNEADEETNSQRLTDGGYDEIEAAYCFYARKSYRKGEQVLLCYGSYTNLELLEHYGFLLGSKNPSDKAFIPVESSIRCSSQWQSDAVYVHGDGRPSFALLLTLRLWAAPVHLRRTIGQRVYSGLQISVDNEISVMNWLQKTCQKALDGLPTIHDDDCLLLNKVIKLQLQFSEGNVVCPVKILQDEEIRKILQVDETSSLEKQKRSMERFRLALEWRINYKKSLLRCISYCKETIRTLKLT